MSRFGEFNEGGGGGGGGGVSVPHNIIVGGASETVSTIEIPGLSGSPDIIVPAGSGNSQYNDEFDQNGAGTPAGWTAFGSGSVLNTNDALSHLHLKSLTNNGCAGIYKAVALTYPCTIIAKITDQIITASSQAAGIIVSPVAPGSAGTGYAVRQTSLPAISSINMATLAETGISNLTEPQLIPFYAQWAMASATGAQAKFSNGGMVYQVDGAAQTLAANLAYVCLYVNNVNGAAVAAEAFFDWIRFH